MCFGLTAYDIDTEAEIYDAAIEAGHIDEDEWLDLTTRFINTFGDLENEK